jgi:hypothetical protein
VVEVVEDDVPKPGQREVRVRVLAAGMSFTDSQLRAGTYIAGGPRPPFTPGYELVGVEAASVGPRTRCRSACETLASGGDQYVLLSMLIIQSLEQLNMAKAPTATGYCMKCKTQRQIKGAKPITMKNGHPATEGTCPECGTRMFKIGATK